MKKISLLVAVVLISATAAYSQLGFQLGLKGGLNFASLDIANPTGFSTEGATGWHIGAFTTIKITKFAIQPEIIYSAQGGDISVSGVADALSTDLDYVTIPIMIKFYLVGGLNLQAGPQFGILLNGEQEIIDPLSGNVTTDDIKDFISSSDLSLGLGAGVDLPFGLNLGVRYNLGLSDINDTLAGFDETKNKVFQVSIGYAFVKKG